MEQGSEASGSGRFFQRSIWRGWEAAKLNRIPAMGLWIFGILLIVGYFFVPAIQDILVQVGDFKTRWGLAFSAVSTAIFGGALPVFVSWLVGKRESDSGFSKSGFATSYLVSNVLFWAVKGVEVDLLYRFQAMIFGDDPNLKTIAMKLVVDQLVYLPILGLLNVILFYHWRDCNFSVKLARETIGPNWYVQRVLPVMVANWIVWIPAVVLIYCLPLPLQLPVQNLILCFWVLVLGVFANNQNAAN